jgi:hypothetical protein
MMTVEGLIVAVVVVTLIHQLEGTSTGMTCEAAAFEAVEGTTTVEVEEVEPIAMETVPAVAPVMAT